MFFLENRSLDVVYDPILLDGPQLLHNDTERMKVTPLVTIKVKVADNLPAPSFSARVNHWFAERPLNTLANLVPLEYNE